MLVHDINQLTSICLSLTAICLSLKGRDVFGATQRPKLFESHKCIMYMLNSIAYGAITF